ncbi:hypothetical protein B4Q13_24985, partial [Lacticaseibacillus rhamnosus]
AGFLIGNNGAVESIRPLQNAREDEARHNRFLITPEDYLNAELTADRLGLRLIGVVNYVARLLEQALAEPQRVAA